MLLAGFKSVQKHLIVDIQDMSILMLHDPLNLANCALFHYDLALHGHIHGFKKLWKPHSKLVHVGVDAWNFTPVSLEEILSLL